MPSPKSLPIVNISVSPCDDAHRLGCDQHQINRIVIRIARYFFANGMRVLFGHDWRNDGVMQAVLRDADASLAVTREPNGGPKMVNLVATGGKPLSRVGARAAWDSDGVLEVRALRDEPGIEPFGDLCTELWALRRRLTQMLDPGFRVCLGGKTRGYAGHYAGVAEEAYFALDAGKPLYLIGGFGGATGAVCDAILERESPIGNTDRPLDARDASCVAKHGDNAPLPLDGLKPAFSELGLDKLSKDNGLTPDENRRMFEMTDIEAVLGLIGRGVTRIRAVRSARP